MLGDVPPEAEPSAQDQVPTPGQRAPIMALNSARILVVDDTASARMLITAFLRNAGYENVVQAEDGLKALEEVGKAKPDLIILDLMMPGLDGFEVCRRLRANDDTMALPVLIQSARGETDAIKAAFEAGASDMISKPINQIEFISRVRAHLSSQFLFTQLEMYKSRMTRELADARAMQMEICPDQADLEAIAADYGYHIDFRFDPSSELGGDVWGLFPVSSEVFGFYLADFSGHGVAAALNTFRLHTLLTQSTDLSQSPGQILGQLNRHLCGVLRTGQFATMLLGFVDGERQKLTYAAAGAPPFMLIPSDDALPVAFHETRGLPLGISEEVDYDNREAALPSGYRLLAYSDVVIEATDEDGRMLEQEGLQAVVERHRSQVGGPEIVRSVLDGLMAFANGELKDDLTIVCIRDGLETAGS